MDDCTTAFLATDGAQAAIDDSGTRTVTTDYDVFGAARSQTGASLSLGFTGELTDPTTGFLDLRARDLDPSLGRFLSRDTVSPNAPGTQGYNPYAYVANNPAAWADPSGKSASYLTAPAASGTVATSIAAILFLSTVATACLLTVGCAPFLALGGVLFSGTGLLVLTGLVVAVFALIACSLNDACSSATQRIGQTIKTYGSTAAVGGWNGLPDDARNAPQAFPIIPLVDSVINEYQHLSTHDDGETSSGESTSTSRVRGLPPAGINPPAYNPETWRTGPASRPSEASRGGQSIYDPDGGEWRYYPEDKWHDPHWDYNPHNVPNSPWQNVPLVP